MTIWRTRWGINKAEDAGRKDAHIGFSDALRRAFPTMVSSSPISRLDLPGDLVRLKFSNITFEATRRQR